ncbi:hypothetical protein [Methylobacterium sp. WSM2598]|uniref:hypothetical protein n=1 Tax=Methylobacterium sp. WSM2598 TaxID=398261 RepID=UPI0012F696BB|nr:hypothetical protein [Methylobacterium sp. WSM2598]
MPTNKPKTIVEKQHEVDALSDGELETVTGGTSHKASKRGKIGEDPLEYLKVTMEDAIIST